MGYGLSFHISYAICGLIPYSLKIDHESTKEKSSVLCLHSVFLIL